MSMVDQPSKKMKNKIHKCEKCGHIFTFAWNLKQHLKHSKYCGTSEEEFKCANCNKQFTLSATLKHHFARCIAVDPYRFACPHCPRKFTFKSSLRKHLRGRCPNINYDALKAMNEADFECMRFQELEVVHEDEIDVRDPDIKTELSSSNIKAEQVPLHLVEKEEFLTGDMQENNLDIKIESAMEIKFIYEDNSQDKVEIVQKLEKK